MVILLYMDAFFFYNNGRLAKGEKQNKKNARYCYSPKVERIKGSPACFIPGEACRWRWRVLSNQTHPIHVNPINQSLSVTQVLLSVTKLLFNHALLLITNCPSPTRSLLPCQSLTRHITRFCQSHKLSNRSSRQPQSCRINDSAPCSSSRQNQYTYHQ